MKPTRRRLLQLAAVVPVAAVLPAPAYVPPRLTVVASVERSGRWSCVVVIAECVQCGGDLRGADGWPLRLPWRCRCGDCSIFRSPVTGEPIVTVGPVEPDGKEKSCDVFRPDLLWGGKMIGDPWAGGWTLGEYGRVPLGHRGKPRGNP